MTQKNLYIITEVATAELDVKKSLFLATAKPILSINEVKPFIRGLRKQHHKARHVVWAYLVGDNQETPGMSDDGEPSGTAGRPILSMLEKEGYTNLLLSVVRYFGGTKLGTGGLIRAYTEAAKLALARSPKIELIKKKTVSLVLPYDIHKTVNKLLEQHQAQLLDTRYDDQVHICYEIAETAAADCQLDLIDKTQNRIQFYE